MTTADLIPANLIRRHPAAAPHGTQIAPLALALVAPFALGADRPLAWIVFAGLSGFAMAFRSLLGPPWANWPAGVATPVALGGAALIWAFCQTGPAAISVDPQAGQLAVLRGLSYGVVFLLSLDLGRSAAAPRLGLALWIVGGVGLHAFVALALLDLGNDSALWGEKTAYLGVATGGFVNRNAFAAQLGMGCLVGLGVLWHAPCAKAERMRRQRLAVMLALAAIFAALIATGSRMGLAATLAGAAVMASRQVGGHRPRRFNLWAIPVAAIGMIVLLSRLERLERLEADLTTRLQLYRQVLGLIADRPWTGHGLDGFALAFQRVQAAPLPAEMVWRNAHSAYLSLWADLGLLAGSLPILALLLLAATLWRRGAWGDPLALAALGVLVQAAVHSTVDFSFEVAANVYLLALILALGLTAPPPSPAQEHP